MLGFVFIDWALYTASTSLLLRSIHLCTSKLCPSDDSKQSLPSLQNFRLTSQFLAYFPVVCRDFPLLEELTIYSFSPTTRHDKEFYKTYSGMSNLQRLSALKMFNMQPQDILFMCMCVGQRLRHIAIENHT